MASHSDDHRGRTPHLPIPTYSDHSSRHSHSGTHSNSDSMPSSLHSSPLYTGSPSPIPRDPPLRRMPSGASEMSWTAPEGSESDLPADPDFFNQIENHLRSDTIAPPAGVNRWAADINDELTIPHPLHQPAARCEGNERPDGERLVYGTMPGPPLVPRVLDRVNEMRNWAESVANKKALDPLQREDLVGLVELADSQAVPIVQMFVWMTACQYETQNETRAACEETRRMAPAIEKLLGQMEDTWDLSDPQKTQVRRHIRDTIVNPGRTKFGEALQIGVQEHLKKDADSFGLSKVFGDKIREDVLKRFCKEACGKARNVLKDKILGGVFPLKGKALKLDDHTHEIMAAFKKNGATGLSIEHYLQVLLLRRYAKDHKYETKPKNSGGENEEDSARNNDNSSNISNVTNASQQQPSDELRRSSAPPGRVPKDQAFWPYMEQRLADAVQKNGRDVKNTEWRQFYSDLFAEDAARYGVCSFSLPESYPVPRYIPSVPTTAPPSQRTVWNTSSAAAPGVGRPAPILPGVAGSGSAAASSQAGPSQPNPLQYRF
ncbi:hypothetical protein CONPUDRAFT_159540 [Coniophora puteana RWD-64-598 SS2]|uniref:Uncharacterized protein n=1 Tax=Coniophora puteana (strain RWD-64-598) TaxID=741705 RepID=A0A5M3M747_CONPW|nr:uncharacterized protein CONPUDRAFT_159540 [Coniophora puteana RWD-64-598 SS2]EIW74756.1 hypothetical protein CONPUDRAFT_159540 [Coniophora puteana RWD-64-598 SS2]